MGSCQGQSRGYQPKADTPTATLIVLVITKNLIQTYNCFIQYKGHIEQQRQNGGHQEPSS